jgi:hypothetical protein
LSKELAVRSILPLLLPPFIFSLFKPLSWAGGESRTRLLSNIFTYCCQRLTASGCIPALKQGFSPEFFYKGQLIAAVSLPVRSPRWRTWSKKTIYPEAKKGEILGEISFYVNKE